MPFVPDPQQAPPTRGRFVPDPQPVAPAAPAAPAAPVAPTAEPGIMSTIGDGIAKGVRVAQGVGDLALSGIANAVATPLAGIAGLAVRPVAALQGYDPNDASAAVIEDIRARATPGQAGQELLAPLAPLAEKAGNVVRDLLPDTPAGQTVLPAVGEAALELANIPAAAAIGKAVKTANAAKVAIPEPPVGSPAIAKMRQQGYYLRPSDVKAHVPSADVPGTFAERFHDSGNLENNFILHNQQITTREAGIDIGIKDAAWLDDAAFDKVKAPEFKIYTDAETAATRVPLSGDLQAALQEGITRAKFKPGAKVGITNTIGALRRRAARQVKSNDVATQESGFMDRELADRLEEAFGKQLEAVGDAQLLTQYQAARRRLAKIHDVETVTRSGQVDAIALAKLKRRGIPLTGRLLMIAEAADTAENVMRHSRITARGSAQELPSTVAGGIKAMAGVLARNVPGTRSFSNVASEGFQNRLGPVATDAQRSYFGSKGQPQPRQKPFQKPKDSGLTFTPQGGVTPARASTLAGDLELDNGAGIVGLRGQPMTAETPPPVRGDIDFTPTQMEASQLAGDLGLEAPATRYPGSIDYEPESLAALLVGDQRIAPPRLEAQAELPAGAGQREKLQLTEPAGPKKGKVTHVSDETGQHTVETPTGSAMAQENGDFLQLKRIDVDQGSRRQGTGRAMMERLLEAAEEQGLLGITSDVSVSPAHAKMFDDLEKRGYEVVRNPSEMNPRTGNLVSTDPRLPIFEVRATLGTAIAPPKGKPKAEQPLSALLRPQAE